MIPFENDLFRVIKPNVLVMKAALLRLSKGNRSSCVRLCVLGASRRSAAHQTEQRSGEGSEGKDVRYHGANFGVCLLVLGQRRRGAELRNLAGHPGAWLSQSERDVPRGGGVDGGHPTHTGGSCRPGLRHLLFIH